jgi:tRNA-specific 2-thiouridylase
MPELEEQVDGGQYIYKDKVVGKHRGYPFYTIGQRKGLEIAMGEPVFVKEIIPESNTVILGDKDDLLENHMRVRDYNIIKYDSLSEDFQALTKIRYKDLGMMATVNTVGNELDVIFHQSVSGIAPGQSAVFYEGDDLIGGGFIQKKKMN